MNRLVMKLSIVKIPMQTIWLLCILSKKHERLAHYETELFSRAEP